MKSFKNTVKVDNKSIDFVSTEPFKFVTGRKTYSNGTKTMKEAAVAFYKTLNNNCCFMILGVCDSHFIMTGFKHQDLNYGYCECKDYWGSVYRFIDNGGVIKDL